MARALTESEIKTIHESANLLQGHGPEIATKMYDHFFEAHPTLKSYFSTCFLGKKQEEDGKPHVTLMAKVMAHILFQFCIHIDNLEKFRSDCERVSAKHVSREIKPEYYPYLRDALLLALKEVLGDKPEVLNVWHLAYDYISEVFIENEKKLVKEIKEQSGGWEGFRKFKVVERKDEVDIPSSASSDDEEEELTDDDMKTIFHLEPVDGSKTLPEHKFGQYICVRFNLPGGVSHRNYTLHSIADGKMILVVKHAEVAPTSKYILENWKQGSEMELSPPMGQFLLLETLAV